MAKVQQKSEKISAFGGIFFVLDRFDRILSSVIDSHQRSGGQVIDFFLKGEGIRESKRLPFFRLARARRSRARQSPKDPSTSYIQQHRSIRRHEPSDVDLLQVHASRHGLYLSVYP